MVKHTPRKKKQAVVLLETLIALVIMAVITVPWINFLRVRSITYAEQELDLFFKTKSIFIKTINHENTTSTNSTNNVKFVTNKIPLGSGLIQLQVDCIRNGKTVYSLIGVMNE